jgi:hypothetical protein
MPPLFEVRGITNRCQITANPEHSQSAASLLGALIPIRMENLLPAAKNIGTTHITNGCYRMHPVEWNIGEAAGALRR